MGILRIVFPIFVLTSFALCGPIRAKARGICDLESLAQDYQATYNLAFLIKNKHRGIPAKEMLRRLKESGLFPEFSERRLTQMAIQLADPDTVDLPTGIVLRWAITFSRVLELSDATLWRQTKQGQKAYAELMDRYNGQSETKVAHFKIQMAIERYRELLIISSQFAEQFEGIEVYRDRLYLLLLKVQSETFAQVAQLLSQVEQISSWHPSEYYHLAHKILNQTKYNRETSKSVMEIISEYEFARMDGIEVALARKRETAEEIINTFLPRFSLDLEGVGSKEVDWSKKLIVQSELVKLLQAKLANLPIFLNGTVDPHKALAEDSTLLNQLATEIMSYLFRYKERANSKSVSEYLIKRLVIFELLLLQEKSLAQEGRLSIEDFLHSILQSDEMVESKNGESVIILASKLQKGKVKADNKSNVGREVPLEEMWRQVFLEQTILRSDHTGRPRSGVRGAFSSD